MWPLRVQSSREAKLTAGQSRGCGAPKLGARRSGKRWRQRTGSADARVRTHPPGDLLRSLSCPRPHRGTGRGRLSRRMEAAPRPSYESAAGQVSRGGSYGKAPGEGRGASTVAISRLAEHFWHSWDPQEFAFWSQGGCIEERSGPYDGHGSRDRAGGTGEKGSGRG